MNPSPSSTPSHQSPARTRSTGAAARTASGGAASGLTELAIVPLLLVLVSLGLRLLTNPRMRADDRAAAQRAICRILGVCLRVAFRQGLPAGRALLAVLRGTVLERKGSLLRKAVTDDAAAEALPMLDAAGAGRIEDALKRYLRRTLGIGASRNAANARRVAASPRGRARVPSNARNRAPGMWAKDASRERPAREKRVLTGQAWRDLIVAISQ